MRCMHAGYIVVRIDDPCVKHIAEVHIFVSSFESDEHFCGESILQSALSENCIVLLCVLLKNHLPLLILCHSNEIL